MDGPAFSTRAESEFNRRQGFDVIGMTNLPEAKLAREAEIALATMAMITDYDCWKVEEEPVSAEAVFGHLVANAEAAKKILTLAIPQIPAEPTWPAHSCARLGPRHRAQTMARANRTKIIGHTGAFPRLKAHLTSGEGNFRKIASRNELSKDRTCQMGIKYSNYKDRGREPKKSCPLTELNMIIKIATCLLALCGLYRV